MINKNTLYSLNNRKKIINIKNEIPKKPSV